VFLDIAIMKLVLAFGLVLSLLAVSSTAEDFDFFYFVQQVMTETTIYIHL
jgi:hypothetical protein